MDKKALLGALSIASLFFFLMRTAKASTMTGPEYLAQPAFTRFDSLFKFYAARHGIPDWRWLKAIAGIESNYGDAPSVRNGILRPDDISASASSDKKSWGVMQTVVATANDMRAGVTVPMLNDPETSIDIGAKYFAWLLKRYNGQVDRAVKGYNQGPGNTDKGFPYADGYYSKWTAELSKITQKQGI